MGQHDLARNVAVHCSDTRLESAERDDVARFSRLRLNGRKSRHTHSFRRIPRVLRIWTRGQETVQRWKLDETRNHSDFFTGPSNGRIHQREKRQSSRGTESVSR